MELPFDGISTFIYSFLSLIVLSQLSYKAINKGLDVFKRFSE